MAALRIREPRPPEVGAAPQQHLSWECHALLSPCFHSHAPVPHHHLLCSSITYGCVVRQFRELVQPTTTLSAKETVFQSRFTFFAPHSYLFEVPNVNTSRGKVVIGGVTNCRKKLPVTLKTTVPLLALKEFQSLPCLLLLSRCVK